MLRRTRLRHQFAVGGGGGSGGSTYGNYYTGGGGASYASPYAGGIGATGSSPPGGSPSGEVADGAAPHHRYMSRSARVSLDPASFVEVPPRNKVLNIVPQGRQYVVERLGRYHRTLDPGWWVVLPMVDRIRYTYNVKEQGIEIPNQSAITTDNVMVEINGVLFLRIIDAEKASYNVDNPIFNLINLAQTTMRSEIGRMNLDTLFRERQNLNKNIVDTLRREAFEWGIECKRYEIRDIVVSDIVRQSMDLQAEAERRKRKLILESEGDARAEINRAEGLKVAQELAADANKYAVLRHAEAEGEAVRIAAEAAGANIRIVAEALQSDPHAREAVSIRVAERYIEKFGELAKSSTSVVLSQPISDPAAFSTQALSIFNSVSRTVHGGAAPATPAAAGSPGSIAAQ